MDGRAEFLLAQYHRDPIRREPKNVGVIVLTDRGAAARFLGERAGSDIDLRTVRWSREPAIYQQWVEHWREELDSSEGDLIKRLSRTNGGNFDVIPGGAVTGINGDSPAEICAHLFPLMVDADAEADPDATTEVDSSLKEMARDITKRFSDLGILGGRVHNPPPNPVWVRPTVKGKRAEHQPQYSQVSGIPCIMEVVNFMAVRKSPVKDHAGWAAKMFDDIRDYRPQTDTIALIRAGKDDLLDKTVRYALALLEDSARIVNLSDPDQERQFFSQREQVALGPIA